MSPSRQFEHLQQQSLATLKALVPSDCPLVVQRWSTGFAVLSMSGDLLFAGRYEVLAAWVHGYVAAWTAAQHTEEK